MGPRPETEEYVLRWKHVVPDYDRRFCTLPGMTGLAQLSGYPDTDMRGIARRAQYDLFYVDHRSLLLDVRTLAWAFMVVLRGVPTPAPAVTPVRSVESARILTTVLAEDSANGASVDGTAPAFRQAMGAFWRLLDTM